MAKCLDCSHANRAAATFCTRCGAALTVEAAMERPQHAVPDEAVQDLTRRGLGCASQPNWSESRVGGKRFAALLRAAALAERERGATVTRGDLAARQALELLRSEVAVAGFDGFSRDGTGVVSGWGSLAAGQGNAAAVFRARDARGPMPVVRSVGIVELLAARGDGDGR